MAINSLSATAALMPGVKRSTKSPPITRLPISRRSGLSSRPRVQSLPRRIFQQKSNIAYVRRLSAGVAHASAQANGRKPARHGEAHSSTGERDRGRASVGRGRQGNVQDQGTAEERRRGDGQKMSDEPLAREREPIERVRARLEALVMANA